MDTALYLLPVTLGDTPIESVLPSYNKEIIRASSTSLSKMFARPAAS